VRQGGSEVAKWLDQLDVYLQPSYQEGLPRATIEALNRGLLVIGSTAGGIPELLPAERMHTPGDAESLATCISRLAKVPIDGVLAETQRNLEVADRYSYTRSLSEKRRVYRALREWCDRPGAPCPVLKAPE